MTLKQVEIEYGVAEEEFLRPLWVMNENFAKKF